MIMVIGDSNGLSLLSRQGWVTQFMPGPLDTVFSHVFRPALFLNQALVQYGGNRHRLCDRKGLDLPHDITLACLL